MKRGGREESEESEEWMENLSTSCSGGVVGWGEREV